MNEMTRVNLSQWSLLPRLQELVQRLRNLAWTKGIDTIIPSGGGLRDAAKQWELYKQGRQLLSGYWVPVDPVHHIGIVTWAIPGKAPHCAHVDLDGSSGSAACDLAIVVNEKIAWVHGQPGYDTYPILGAAAESLGLVWGGRWGKLADLDHVELADWRSLASGFVPKVEAA